MGACNDENKLLRNERPSVTVHLLIHRVKYRSICIHRPVPLIQHSPESRSDQRDAHHLNENLRILQVRCPSQAAELRMQKAWKRKRKTHARLNNVISVRLLYAHEIYTSTWGPPDVRVPLLIISSLKTSINTELFSIYTREISWLTNVFTFFFF